MADVPMSDARWLYPDPCDHCAVCRWWVGCNERRRKDDHLSFVAGLGRAHRLELAQHDVTTLRALAEVPLPIPFQPDRGSRDTYTRLREQARLQLEQREAGRAKFELLPAKPGAGLALLPEPSAGDLFLDLEGDPFGRFLGTPAPRNPGTLEPWNPGTPGPSSSGGRE